MIRGAVPAIVVGRSLLLGISVVMAGCVASPAATPGVTPPVGMSTAPPPTPIQSAGPVQSVAVSPDPAVGAGTSRPPVASLTVEGGDPVAGALGSYTWGEAGSDSPWLQGAPMSIGHGETMVLTVDPAVDVEAWEARVVPAGADGPGGGHVIGRGRGVAMITPSDGGAWTLEVRVVYAGGRGEARYFWRLEVG